MLIPLSSLRLRPRVLLAASLLGLGWLGAPVVSAQTQESGLLNRIQHPDMTLKFDPADASFARHSTYNSKQAQVRPFAFSHDATLRAGDGAFKTRSFADKDKYNTRDFTTKADRVSNSDPFTQKDRGFATKALPVQDAPGSGKSAGFTRDFIPGGKSIVIRGKRQDSIDDIHNQKELSIDEVREILNKYHGRPGSRPDVGTLPALRALPVTAPIAQ